MDTGSPGDPVASRAAPGRIPWLRATLVWMLMMIAETLNGFAREIFIAPAVGALRARQIGVAVGSVVVLAIAWACARWLRAPTRRDQLIIGGYWVALTAVFEVSLARATGLPWSRILSDYNPAQGGWMMLGLAVMFVAPWLAGRRRA